MNHSSSRTDIQLVFCDQNYSESDYLSLARNYRNEKAGEIIIAMFAAISRSLGEKLRINWLAHLKRA